MQTKLSPKVAVLALSLLVSAASVARAGGPGDFGVMKPVKGSVAQPQGGPGDFGVMR